MGIPGGANLLLAAGGVSRYEIDQSLRFDGSSYLSKTFSSSGNRETNTLSLWCKRSFLAAFGDNNFTLVTADPNNNYDEIGFTQNYGNTQSDEVWYRIQGGYYVIPNNLFRDVSAWTHLVFRRDGTQSTAANRLRIYVNGAEATYRATNYQPQNQVWGKLCHSCDHRIGTYDNTYQKFKGYMAELHLVDGQSLGPDSFGEYDENGVWRPIAYGGTYGTNGIYMKFDPSASNGIGHDHSGNGHHFTATGFTTSGTGTDVMSDTPTNNYATLNPLSTTAGTYSEGNLIYYPASGWRRTHGTIGVSSGKWYYEFTLTSSPYSPRSAGSRWAGFGFGLLRFDESTYYDTEAITLFDNGYRANWSTGTPTYTDVNSASFSNGDVLSIAVDIDAGTYAFRKNNVSVDSGSIGAASGAVLFPHIVHDTSAYSNYVVNFGQRAFAYTPPTGYKSLNTSNLPAPDISKGSDYFNTVLYTGTSASTQAITGVNFQPDFVWIKNRGSSTDHLLFDAVRGVTKILKTVGVGAEETDANAFQSFDSDGFTLGTSTNGNPTKANGATYAAWCWDAGGSGSSNTSGSITSTVSANPSAGFSIITWNTSSSSGYTVGHGLGVAPKVLLLKKRDANSNWFVRHGSIHTGNGALFLNSYSVGDSGSTVFDGTNPSSTLIYLNGTSTDVRGDQICYAFAEVEGYSKLGSFTGNGSTDGPFIATSFSPAFLIWRRTDSTANWFMVDAARNTYNPVDKEFYPDQPNAEYTFTDVDFLSNGFKLRASAPDRNANGGTFIYMCFASNPFGGSGVSPATAR